MCTKTGEWSTKSRIYSQILLKYSDLRADQKDMKPLFRNTKINSFEDQRENPRNRLARRSALRGQSLIEIMIGIAVLSIFLVGSVLVLTNVLRVGKTNQ